MILVKVTLYHEIWINRLALFSVDSFFHFRSMGRKETYKKIANLTLEDGNV